MSGRRRSPRPLGTVIAPMHDRLAPQTLLAQVQERWSETVGAAIAAQALPTAERSGVLTVSCVASVWAQELDLMAPQILAALNRHLGSRRILRLRCVVAAPP